MAQPSDLEEQALLRKLKWRCRRGMRELDQLMERYLDRRWPQAPTAERALFLRLLETEDDKLWRWVMSREQPEDAELGQFIEILLELPP